MSEMQSTINLPVVASGGVTTLDDVRALSQAGLSGCIIGRAIYEGTIDLQQAVELAGKN
jgi:phosphoribosylformimino-5-aminoimidazole carboxamide ribotide isomerase